jgi:TRAP transporter TAXI family solute receptor
MANHSVSFIFAVITVFVFSATAFPSSALASDLPKFITIMGYPVGSLGSLFATGFCSAIDKQTSIKARPTPADTDMGRLLPVKKGESQAMVVTGATCYVASNGLQEFSAKGWGPQKLRLVYAGNRMFMGMAVKANSGIKTWSDLKGKKVAMGPGFLGLAVPGLLAYGGLQINDVVIVRAAGFVAGIDMVMNNAADCCYASAQGPTLKQWESAPYGLRYLPFDPKNKEGWERMNNIAPFMSPGWVELGALGEGGPKWLVFYPYVLSSYESVDDKIIFLIVKSLVEGRNVYKDVNKPDSEYWTLEETLNLTKPIFTPFHSGLIKFAKEKGKWTAEHEAWQAKALSEEEKRIKTYQSTK